MRPPGAELTDSGEDPVAFLQGRGRAARGQDLEDTLITGDDRGLGGANEGGEGWFRAIGSLDGVDIGGVNGRSEGSDEDGRGGDGWRDGMGMDSVRKLLTLRTSGQRPNSRNLLEHIFRLSVLGEDERLGLGVAVGPRLASHSRHR